MGYYWEGTPCKVKQEPGRGRFLVATRDVAAGEVVLVSESYLAAAIPTHKKRVCRLCMHDFCRRLSDACTGCEQVWYCCEGCRTADERGLTGGESADGNTLPAWRARSVPHRTVCSVLRCFSSCKFDPEMLSVLFMVIDALAMQHLDRSGEGKPPTPALPGQQQQQHHPAMQGGQGQPATAAEEATATVPTAETMHVSEHADGSGHASGSGGGGGRTSRQMQLRGGTCIGHVFHPQLQLCHADFDGLVSHEGDLSNRDRADWIRAAKFLHNALQRARWPEPAPSPERLLQYMSKIMCNNFGIVTIKAATAPSAAASSSAAAGQPQQQQHQVPGAEEASSGSCSHTSNNNCTGSSSVTPPLLADPPLKGSSSSNKERSSSSKEAGSSSSTSSSSSCGTAAAPATHVAKGCTHASAGTATTTAAALAVRSASGGAGSRVACKGEQSTCAAASAEPPGQQQRHELPLIAATPCAASSHAPGASFPAAAAAAVASGTAAAAAAPAPAAAPVREELTGTAAAAAAAPASIAAAAAPAAVADAAPAREEQTGRVLYISASYLNHSCDPSCAVDRGVRRCTVTAERDIRAGEELSISYINLEQPVAARRAELRRNFFFTCQCTRCQREARQGSDKCSYGRAGISARDGANGPLVKSFAPKKRGRKARVSR